MKSIKNQKWKIAPKVSGSIFHNICKNRGLEDEKFFSPNLDNIPSMKNMLGAEKAKKIVLKSMKNGERIMVFGDYDVDGITSGAILYLGLRELGASVSVRLPHRVTHGYGLRMSDIDECAAHDVKLLITVDCGVSNVEEIRYAKEKNLKVVIIDHHTCPEVLPEADAIVNPKQPQETFDFADFTASALTFLFVKYLGVEGDILKYLCGLSAIGVVADCAPLVKYNRDIVNTGVENMRNGYSGGLKVLADIAGIDLKEMNSETIGFQIAPRINASGRLDDPMVAFELLRGKTEMASKLEELNKRRQVLAKECTHEAWQMTAENQKINFVYSPNWHVGVVGLIAGRLHEETGLPTFAMCKNGKTITGSARTPREFHAREALVDSADLLSHFGGHAQAAGFSLSEKNLKKFEDNLRKLAQKKIKNMPEKVLEIDGGMDLGSDLGLIWAELQGLEPCGIGNEKPLLIAENVQIKNKRVIGQGNTHLKCEIENVSAVGWSMFEKCETVTEMGRYDVAVKILRNEWKGNVKYELEMVDVRRSGE